MPNTSLMHIAIIVYEARGEILDKREILKLNLRGKVQIKVKGKTCTPDF